MNKLIIFLVLFLLACSRNVKKIDPNNFALRGYYIESYVNPKKILPLRKEWPELYRYLVNNHIIMVKPIHNMDSEKTYFLSRSFDRFFTQNRSKVLSTPFLQHLDNFEAAFGELNKNTLDSEIISCYNQVVYEYNFLNIKYLQNNSCFTFDEKTKLMKVYGQINHSIGRNK